MMDNAPSTLEFRKANAADIEAVSAIYDSVHDAEAAGITTSGWQRGIYPTRSSAEEALAAGDLFVATEKGTVVASARINRSQLEAYAKADWEYKADDSQVCVIHTLVVNPACIGKGYGKAFMRFYEQYALATACPFLRLDTDFRNRKARGLYASLGYKEVAVIPTFFQGEGLVDLVLLEKNLNA